MPAKILESRDGVARAKTTHFDPFLGEIVLNKLTFTPSGQEIEPKIIKNKPPDRADNPKIFAGKPHDGVARLKKPHYKPYKAIVLIIINFKAQKDEEN